MVSMFCLNKKDFYKIKIHFINKMILDNKFKPLERFAFFHSFTNQVPLSPVLGSSSEGQDPFLRAISSDASPQVSSFLLDRWN